MRVAYLYMLILATLSGAAQLFIPAGNNIYNLVDRITIKSGNVVATNFHSSQKPYTYEEVLRFLNINTYYFTRLELNEANRFLNQAFFYNTRGRNEHPYAKYFYRYNASLFGMVSNDLKLSVNPVLGFAMAPEFGKTQGNTFNKMLYQNTRGAEIQGVIDNKFSFYILATDNQMRVPLQVKQYGDATYALPGESYFKKFKGNGVDFLHAEAYVAGPVSKHISWQFGNLRQFIGDGSRSLILSDFSKPHLFLKLNTNIWKINYQNLFYELTDSAYSTGAAIFKKKYGATHILSVNFTNRFNLGLFETVIFKRDQNAFELNYLNPVIFYRAAEHSLGSPDNVLLGMHFKYTLKPKIRFYGQLVLDEFVMKEMRTQIFKSKSNKDWGWWGNKFATQIGLKAVDVFNLRNIDFQLEYNLIRPYTYAYTNTSLNYTDFNQSMAHPMGANLKELLLVVNYLAMENLNFQLRTFYTLTGIDTSGVSYGGDLLKSTHDKPLFYGVATGQGLKAAIGYVELSGSYRIAEQLFADLSFTARSRKTNMITYNNQNYYISLGLRLNCAKRDFMY